MDNSEDFVGSPYIAHKAPYIAHDIPYITHDIPYITHTGSLQAIESPAEIGCFLG